MVEPYIHTEMPPVVRKTADEEWVLEGQSGVQIATYNQSGMNHPEVWWSDLIEAMAANYDTATDAIHDLTLLMMRGDYQVVDDRGN